MAWPGKELGPLRYGLTVIVRGDNWEPREKEKRFKKVLTRTCFPTPVVEYVCDHVHKISQIYFQFLLRSSFLACTTV